jgi:hypothetical protein
VKIRHNLLSREHGWRNIAMPVNDGPLETTYSRRARDMSTGGIRPNLYHAGASSEPIST